MTKPQINQALDELMNAYQHNGTRVQKSEHENAPLLMVHIPTTIHHPLNPYKRGTTSYNPEEVISVASTARSVADKFGLELLMDEARFSAGGIYVTYIKLEEKKK